MNLETSVMSTIALTSGIVQANQSGHYVVATTYHNDKWSYKAVNLLKWNIKWEIHKRTRQGASFQLESYLYKRFMVCATNI